MQKPKKTITIAMWPQPDGTWFQTTVEKRGKWFIWDDGTGQRGSRRGPGCGQE